MTSSGVFFSILLGRSGPGSRQRQAAHLIRRGARRERLMGAFAPAAVSLPRDVQVGYTGNEEEFTGRKRQRL